MTINTKVKFIMTVNITLLIERNMIMHVHVAMIIINIVVATIRINEFNFTCTVL